MTQFKPDAVILHFEFPHLIGLTSTLSLSETAGLGVSVLLDSL